MGKREQVLSALFARLQTIAGASVLRNEVLPHTVPAGGLVIMRDGEPGEPDVTLNPRTEYFSHSVEIEAFVTQPASGSGEADLDDLLSAVAAALAPDRSLGGLAEYIFMQPAIVAPFVTDGAVPVLAASAALVVEYLVSDPLAA